MHFVCFDHVCLILAAPTHLLPLPSPPPPTQLSSSTNSGILLAVETRLAVKFARAPVNGARFP